MIYEYRGCKYPSYLKDGNAVRFAMPFIQQFCIGKGIDVGCGRWPVPGAYPVDVVNGGDAMNLPLGQWDYVASSHCLEHLNDPISAIEHWKTRIKPGGVIFLYLPSPDMRYWRPEHCRRHRHLFYPRDVAEMLEALGFVNVLHSERDLAWSFAVVGFVPS